MTTTDLTDLLGHYDILDQDHEDRKWEIFEHARLHHPVAWTDANGGFFLVTRYDDVRRVLEDWETFSSLESPMFPTPASLCPITNDPPIQTHARRLLNPLFSKSQLAPYEPRIRAVANDLIDKFVERGSFEVMGEFAGPLVAHTLAEMVFSEMSDEEMTDARRVADEVGHSPGPETFQQLALMSDRYLDKAAGLGDMQEGVLKAITQGTFDGEPVPRELQAGILGILILGGLDTTRGAITSIAYRVADTPGLEERLRDPRWVRRDLDEFLRLDSPVAAMARVATKDVELNGTLIRKGQRVEVRYDSANRDATVFPEPDRLTFEVARPGHAAFGMGVHRCVGSNLALLQIQIAFEELLSRVTNLRLATDAPVRWLAGNSNSIAAVDLDFDRVSPVVDPRDRE